MGRKGLEEGSYDETQRELEFDMPAKNVKAKAIFKTKKYKVSTGMFCKVMDNDEKYVEKEFAPGEKVTVVADNGAISYIISNWKVNGIVIEKYRELY